MPMCSHRALGVFMEVVLNSWPDYLHTPASPKSDSDSYCVPPESMAFINCMYWNCLMEGRHDVLGQGTEENRSLVPGFLLSWPGVSLSLLRVSLATPSQIESEDYSLSAGLSVTKQEPPVMSVWRDVQAALWFPEPVPWAMTFPRASWFFPLSLSKDWKSGGCVCVWSWTFLIFSAGLVLEKWLPMKAGFCGEKDNILGPTMSPSPSLGRVKKFGFVLHGEDLGTVWMEGHDVKVHICDVLYSGPSDWMWSGSILFNLQTVICHRGGFPASSLVPRRLWTSLSIQPAC